MAPSPVDDHPMLRPGLDLLSSLASELAPPPVPAPARPVVPARVLASAPAARAASWPGAHVKVPAAQAPAVHDLSLPVWVPMPPLVHILRSSPFDNSVANSSITSATTSTIQGNSNKVLDEQIDSLFVCDFLQTGDGGDSDEEGEEADLHNNQHIRTFGP